MLQILILGNKLTFKHMPSTFLFLWKLIPLFYTVYMAQFLASPWHANRVSI